MLTRICIVKAMVFPVVTCGCESWTIKKAEHWRTDAFKLWRWRRLNLENPSDCMEIKPVNPKGHHPWIFTGRTDAEAEASILWSPDVKSQLTGKYPDAGKDQRPKKRVDRGWDGCMASLTQRTWVWASSGSWWWTGNPGMLQSMGSQRVRHDWVTELNWLRLLWGDSKLAKMACSGSLAPHFVNNDYVTAEIPYSTLHHELFVCSHATWCGMHICELHPKKRRHFCCVMAVSVGLARRGENGWILLRL